MYLSHARSSWRYLIRTPVPNPFCLVPNEQVYYVPLVPVVDGDCMPTLLAFFPIFRQILIRERITLVHGHQASSVMSHEAIHFAKTMGYRVAYTDHSLFGFADAAR